MMIPVSVLVMLWFLFVLSLILWSEVMLRAAAATFSLR